MFHSTIWLSNSFNTWIIYQKYEKHWEDFSNCILMFHCVHSNQAVWYIVYYCCCVLLWYHSYPSFTQVMFIQDDIIVAVHKNSHQEYCFTLTTQAGWVQSDYSSAIQVIEARKSSRNMCARICAILKSLEEVWKVRVSVLIRWKLMLLHPTHFLLHYYYKQYGAKGLPASRFSSPSTLSPAIIIVDRH